MEETLKEIVEALREHNELTREILQLWNIVEERTKIREKSDNIHNRASAFIVFDRLRKQYNESLEDLVKNQDNDNLRLATEWLRTEVLDISKKIFSNEKLTLFLPEVSDMVDYHSNKKEEGDKK